MTGRLSRLRDLAVPVAGALWVTSVVATRGATMDDWGLLAVLPPAFYVSIALVVISSVVLLRARRLSPLRLSLHLVALVVMLHATVPLTTGEPLYPWVYKHIGVAEAIDMAGGVDPEIDIYQNWPGFFGASAWLTELTGVDGPLALAAWAPVFFNLATCAVLVFAYRALPTSPRTRWIALFIFVAGNWVGQDYFAPQALGFVLSMAVMAMTLAWIRSERWIALTGWIQRQFAWIARTKPRPVPGPGEQEGLPVKPARAEAVAAICLVFLALVATHQLSPYMVLAALVPLAVVGVTRPRWVIGLLVLIALAYLVPRLGFLEQSHKLLSPLKNPFAKFFEKGGAPSPEVMVGRRISGLAAPALMFCMGLLAVVGLIRRLREGRPVVLMSFLVFSPAIIAVAQGYGGEAIFRVYLFALPWLALLGASALAPAPALPLGRLRPSWPFVSTTAVLGGAVGLMLLAVVGSAEIYVSRPGEVEAARYFYDRAGPQSRLSLMSPTFPVGIGPRYEEFALLGRSHPSVLTDTSRFRHRVLGATDVEGIAEFVVGPDVDPGGRYLALSYTQEVFARVLGLSPPGAFTSLDRALGGATNWTEWYRNDDAVIYRYDLAGRVEPWDPPPAVPTAQPASHLAAAYAGLAGLALVALAIARRVTRFGLRV